MDAILELLHGKDLSPKLSPLLTALETADPRLLAVGVLVLVFIGSKFVAGQPALRSWGLRLGAGAFLLHAGYECYLAGGLEESNAFDIILRSANVGGGVLAAAWIVLPIAVFVYCHLRLALATFLGYGGYALATADTLDPDRLMTIAERSLLAVVLVLIVAWIVQPVADFFKDLLPKPALPSPSPLAGEGRGGGEASAQRQPQPQSLPVPAERRRRRRTRLARRMAGDLLDLERTLRRRLEAQRRRDRARLKIELLYGLAFPSVETRLSRPAFDDLIERYLNDRLAPEEVEDNAAQLEVMLREQRPAPPASVPAINLFDPAGSATGEAKPTDSAVGEPSLVSAI
jgi:hypothetical protein